MKEASITDPIIKQGDKHLFLNRDHQKLAANISQFVLMNLSFHTTHEQRLFH